MTADKIRELGLAEIACVDAKIEAVAAQASYSGDVSGYRRFLSSDSQFIAASKEALREKLESLAKHIPQAHSRILATFRARL